MINFDLPDSVETYVHRIGRTGRAGKEGTAITLVQPFERRKQQLFERHVRQNWQILSIPTRAQIEARQLEKLQARVKEALAGERMASFLSIVSQLSEEYDAHAIAAAALQIAYDQTRPAWLQSETDFPEEEVIHAPKPKLRHGRRQSSGEHRSRRSSCCWTSSEATADADKQVTPKPKLRTVRQENSVSPKKLGSSSPARESAS